MQTASNNQQDIATLAGGCYWCLEAPLRQLAGVEEVTSGFMGGHMANPDYSQVCNGDTGHAEVIRIQFDPAVIGFPDLLEVFFALHDPTTLNRQGNDIGTQYRSAIFYHSEQQRLEAGHCIVQLAAEQVWPSAIVTEIVPAQTFYPAADAHQHYFENNPFQPYCLAVVGPKVTKLHAKFADRLKRVD